MMTMLKPFCANFRSFLHSSSILKVFGKLPSSVDAFDLEAGKSLVERRGKLILHLALGRATLLVNDDMVAHEADEAIGILPGVHGRDTLTLAKNALLEQVFTLLVEVEVLQVIDQADMVDVAAASAEELVPGALKLLTNLQASVRVDGAA